MSVRIDSIDECIIECEEKVSLSFGESVLMDPYLLQSLFELCAIVAFERYDPETEFNPSDIVFD